MEFASVVELTAGTPCGVQREWESLRSGVGSGASVKSVWPIVSLPEVQPRDGWYWYDPATTGAVAAFEDVRVVAIFHPRYDGFLMTSVTAFAPIENLEIVADDSIAAYVSPHFLSGMLAPGQRRPVDLELHPGAVPTTGVQGNIRALDGDRELGCSLTLTLGTTRRVDCEIASYEGGSALGEAVEAYLAGRQSIRGLVRVVGSDRQRSILHRLGWR